MLSNIDEYQMDVERSNIKVDCIFSPLCTVHGNKVTLCPYHHLKIDINSYYAPFDCHEAWHIKIQYKKMHFQWFFSHSDSVAETAFWPDNFQQCYAETIEQPHPVSMSRTWTDKMEEICGNESEELHKKNITPLNRDFFRQKVLNAQVNNTNHF